MKPYTGFNTQKRKGATNEAHQIDYWIILCTEKLWKIWEKESKLE